MYSCESDTVMIFVCLLLIHLLLLYLIFGSDASCGNKENKFSYDRSRTSSNFVLTVRNVLYFKLIYNMSQRDLLTPVYTEQSDVFISNYFTR